MSHQPIYAELWSPNDAIFKSHKNDPATCEVYYCDMADTCPLLKKKQCINRTILGPKCPHGYRNQHTGFTNRSAKMNSWIAEKKKEYGHLFNNIKGSPPDKVIEVGEWVYLPYAHMDMNKNIPFISHSSLFVCGSPFIKKEAFTLDIIKRLIDFRPMALIGGEITTYQTEIIPKFLCHLEEAYPDLYVKLLDANPGYITKYSLQNKNYVGRTALLHTIAPCEIETGKHSWDWNGKQLVSRVFDTLWVNVQDQNQRKAIDSISVTIVPSSTAVVKITSNGQVLPTTIFVD